MPILIADEKDITSLVALMDSAYRGENSKQGWTSEADLFIGNKRTDETTVANLIKKPGVVFLKYLNEEEILEGCVLLNKKDNRIYLGMFSVSPLAQGKGIGKKLHDDMLDWYFSQTDSAIWLSTAPGTRAEKFYHKAGWKNVGMHGKGEIKFEMAAAYWKKAK